MVVYEAYFKPWAAYQLTVNPPHARSKLHGTILDLMIDPRPASGEALPGYTHLWRIRLGPYRIVYAIDDEKKAVTIIGIGYRQVRPVR